MTFSQSSGNSSSAVASTSGQAAIDTGTTLIVAPSAAAAAFFATIPGALPLPFVGGLGTTFYTIPCDSAPTVNLIFGGKAFDVNPLDLNFGKVSDATGLPELPFLTSGCLAGIIGEDLVPGESLYIVGDTFLKNWYSTYSTEGGSSSVNLARAV